VSDAPPEPPPPRPSTSPFGRFPTQIVGVLAVLVAGVAAVSFSVSGGGGGSNAGPARTPMGLDGTWQGQASLVGGEAARLVLEIRDDGTGTLRRAGCVGRLTPAQTMGDAALFDYSSSERGCPRRTQVSVTQVDEDTLRLEERRLDGRPLLDATLRRR
jgi:hypothetical protein